MSDGIIGSVGVSVAPDANDFWRRFEAQTRAGAAEAGRRAGNQWQREFQAAARDTRINVRADTTRARAEIAALNKETSRSGGTFQKLISAALTLAPAIVPVAAAAGAAAAEFGALGLTGALAFKGLKDELHGTGAEAQVTSALVVTLKESLNQLSKTAASNALPGLAEATTKLRDGLPAVNAEIAQQAQLLGDVASHIAGGLVGGFTAFAPLLNEVSGSVDRIAAKFEAWATGPAGAHFGQVLAQDYARVAPDHRRRRGGGRAPDRGGPRVRPGHSVGAATARAGRGRVPDARARGHHRGVRVRADDQGWRRRVQ
jgi:hypothetical protein